MLPPLLESCRKGEKNSPRVHPLFWWTIGNLSSQLLGNHTVAPRKNLLKDTDPYLKVKAETCQRKSREAPEIAGVRSLLLGIFGKMPQRLIVDASSRGLTKVCALQEDETWGLLSARKTSFM